MERESYLPYFDQQYRDLLSPRMKLPGIKKILSQFHQGKQVSYSPKLRYPGFRIVFEQLLKKKQNSFTIIETGTLRQPDNWAGDGQSSFLFYEFVNFFGGKLISIDVEQKNLDACRHILLNHRPQRDQATLDLRCGDSVSVLHDIDEHVDLLYLDSMDFDSRCPEKSMVHHLKELCSARKMIAKSPGLLVAVDDNGRDVGKGKYVLDWAHQTHQEILYHGYQIVMRITGHLQ